jgi:hypothetical protein
VKESHLLLNKMERFCRRPFSGDKARLVFHPSPRVQAVVTTDAM